MAWLCIRPGLLGLSDAVFRSVYEGSAENDKRWAEREAGANG